MAIPGVLASALGGGAGGLGTVMLRIAADATVLVTEFDRAQRTVLSGSNAMMASVAKLGATVTGVLTAMGVAAVREFAKFESSFADVRKTVDGTDADLNRLSGSLRKMATEIPVNVNEINQIAAAAGQLGIRQKDIQAFTTAMLQMGLTTNLSARDAAEALARFANVTKMPHEAFGQLAAVVSKLDRSTVATAKEIVDMGLRIAAAGSQVGLTRTEILGLAAAVSSIGIHAELGGTAISQVMIRMSEAVNTGGEELEAFAKIAGMSADDFTKAFVEHAGGAYIKFVKGLQQSTKEGKNVFTMLKDIGAEGVRVLQTQIGLAGAGDILVDVLKTSKEAWSDQESLAKLSEERYKTLANQFKVTINLIREVAIQIGEALAPHLKILNGALQEVIKKWDGWGVWMSNVFVNVVVPGALTAIGLVGDAFQQLRAAIKLGQVGFAGFAEVTLRISSTWANTVGKIFALAMNAIITQINLAIKAANLLLPKAKEFQEIKMEFNVDTAKLDEWAKAFKTTREEATKELLEMGKLDSFSDRVLAGYDRIMQGVKEKNKELAKDTKAALIPDLPTVKADLQSINREKAQATLDKMETPGFTVTRSGKKRFTGMLGAGLNQFEDQGVVQMTELQNQLTSSKTQLAELEKIKNQELGLNEKYQAKLEASIEAHNQKIKALQQAKAMAILATSSKMFDDLASIAETWGGRQSAAFKAMFAVSKAFAVAESIVKIQQGLANAFSLPWPMNLAAAASVAAATANIVSTITSTTLEITGKREKGGPVEPNKMFLVGEKGPELFVPTERGQIIPNNMLNLTAVMQRLDLPNINDLGPTALPSQIREPLLPATPTFPVIHLPDFRSERNQMGMRGGAAPSAPAAMERSRLMNITGIATEALKPRHFGGPREDGGPTEPGKFYLVGEEGPELFAPASSGTILPNERLAGGEGGGVKVVINNFTDAKPEVKERQEGNEKVIEVFIRRAKNEMASEIRDGRGEVARALEATYSLARGKA